MLEYWKSYRDGTPWDDWDDLAPHASVFSPPGEISWLFAHKEYFNPVYIPFGVAASFIFFLTCNKLLLHIYRDAKHDRAFWRWHNIAISWLHSCICAAWNLYSFYANPRMMNDLVFFQSPFTYSLVVFSAGYFIYDMYDMAMHSRIFTNWELTTHHVVISTMFIYNCCTQICSGFNMVALLAETNSVFLHLRKLLLLSGYSFVNSWFFCLNAVLNFFTFVVFRLCSMFWVYYGLATESHRAPGLYVSTLTTTTVIMSFISPSLLYQLICADWKAWKTGNIPSYKKTEYNVELRGSISQTSNTNGVHKKSE